MRLIPRFFLFWGVGKVSSNAGNTHKVLQRSKGEF